MKVVCKCIGKYNCLHTAFKCIQQDHQQDHKCCNRKWDVHVFQDKYLQYINDKIKPGSGAKYS